MKKILFIAIMMMISMNVQAKQPFAVDISFDAFYTNLSPYGEWIEIDNGVVVWRPLYVEDNWQPYSNGRWVYTANGWYWDSYEHFGWATAHYGRWLYDNYYGWIWFPDYEWSPAWVEWRYGANNVGWAPLPPYAKFSRSNGIVFSISWKSNYHHWRFVNYAHFCNHNVAMFYQPVRYNKHIWGKTTYHTKYRYRNNRIYNDGIGRDVIERHSHRKIREANIEISNSTTSSRTRNMSNDRVISYRPTTSKSRNNEYNIIKKSNRSSSIERDKLAVGRSIYNKTNNDRISERINNRIETKTKNRSSDKVKNDYNNRRSTVSADSKRKSDTKISKSKSGNDRSNTQRKETNSGSRTRKR